MGTQNYVINCLTCDLQLSVNLVVPLSRGIQGGCASRMPRACPYCVCVCVCVSVCLSVYVRNTEKQTKIYISGILLDFFFA